MIVYEIAIKCFYSVVIVFVLFYHFLCLQKLNGCALWFFFFSLASVLTDVVCKVVVLFKSIHLKKIVMCISEVWVKTVFFHYAFSAYFNRKMDVFFLYYYFLFDVSKSIVGNIACVEKKRVENLLRCTRCIIVWNIEA